MSFRKILFVVSSVSRPGRARRDVPRVQARLEAGGASVDTRVTRAPGDPGRLAGEGAGRYDAVLVAGGDGSINEALNALYRTETPLGIIPLGTVNVFAREMGIPLDPLAAAGAFLEGRARTFDMGCLGERRFLLMASYGFDVYVMRRNPAWLKRIAGRYSYGLTGLFTFPFFRDRPIALFPDGAGTPLTANFAVFSNARCYAGDYVVAPAADMADGLLDLTLFRIPGRIGLVRTFASFLRGTHLAKPWVTAVRCRSVRFETQDLDLFQVDGDPLRAGAREIRVSPRAVRLVVP